MTRRIWGQRLYHQLTTGEVLFWEFQFSSVQFSRSVASDSLQPHESQHTRPPCPSPTPGVCSNSCPSSRWHHPTISSSVVPFSSCPQSLPASGSFPMSQLFTWGGLGIIITSRMKAQREKERQVSRANKGTDGGMRGRRERERRKEDKKKERKKRRREKEEDRGRI